MFLGLAVPATLVPNQEFFGAKRRKILPIPPSPPKFPLIFQRKTEVKGKFLPEITVTLQLQQNRERYRISSFRPRMGYAKHSAHTQHGNIKICHGDVVSGKILPSIVAIL
ncbi:hypothetical protein RQN30_08150 [Arcanobacterium hippocoleae]